MRTMMTLALIPLVCLTLAAQNKGGGTGGSGGRTTEGPVRAIDTGRSIYTGDTSKRSFGSFNSDAHHPTGRLMLRTTPANPGGTGHTLGSVRVIIPPHGNRIHKLPDEAWWRGRDFMADLRLWARQGCIPVHPVDDVAALEDYSQLLAGWKAYGMTVPPKESVTFTLDHSNRGWFGLSLCNKWGTLEHGMIDSLRFHPTPKVTYNNPFDEPRNVYVVVDDPGWMSSEKNPYSFTIQRSWDPAKYGKAGLPQAAGIWAVHRPEKASTKLAVVLWR